MGFVGCEVNPDIALVVLRVPSLDSVPHSVHAMSYGLCSLTLVPVSIWGVSLIPYGSCPSPFFISAFLPRVADHVSVNVELRFGAVVIANTSVSFYDCMAVTEFFPSAP